MTSKKLIQIRNKKKALEEKLAKVHQEAEQLKAKFRKLESEETKENKKTDTRRKILAGAAIFAAIEQEYEINEYKFQRILNKYITRSSDRKFLELDPLPPQNEEYIKTETIASDRGIKPASEAKLPKFDAETSQQALNELDEIENTYQSA